MKKLILSSLAVTALAMTGSAIAADIPGPTYKAPPPVVAPVAWTWTGFYVGASAGYGWSEDRHANITLSPTATSFGSGSPDPAQFDAIVAASAGAIPTTLDTRFKGFIGGGQLGYNQ